jgi:hypothetical protein
MSDQHDEQLQRLVASMLNEAPVAPGYNDLVVEREDRSRVRSRVLTPVAAGLLVVALAVGVAAFVIVQSNSDSVAPADQTVETRCGSSDGVKACIDVADDVARNLRLSGLQPGSSFDASLTTIDGSDGGQPLTLHADSVGRFGHGGGLFGVTGLGRVARLTFSVTTARGTAATITVDVKPHNPTSPTSTPTSVATSDAPPQTP